MSRMKQGKKWLFRNTILTGGLSKKLPEEIQIVQNSRLQEMLEFIREDDVVYVEEFSRLGRSTADLLTIVRKIEDTGARFVSLKEQFDTTTPAGRLQMTMMAAIAEFERDMILERQREGIAIAKAAGIGEYYEKYMTRQGTKVSIAAELGISRTTLDRLFSKYKEDQMKS